MERLRCHMGGAGPLATEACQRLYADTPFRYNWRHTYTSCCAAVSECLALRVRKVRVPIKCGRCVGRRGARASKPAPAGARRVAARRSVRRHGHAAARADGAGEPADADAVDGGRGDAHKDGA